MAIRWVSVPTLVLLAASEAPTARPAEMPSAPFGYTYLEHHAVGDSEHNTRSNMDPPDNLSDTAGVHVPPCKPSPGAEDCLSVAHTTCEKTEGCVAFALLNLGANEDPATVSSYQLYRAGLGNAIVNTDWYLYARLKTCGSCPNGAAAQASALASAASGAPAQTHACTTLGQVYPCGHPGASGCTPALKEVQVYCSPDSAWGTAFLLAVALGGGGYLVGGVVVGGRQHGRAASLSTHPHYQRWLETRSLVSDGISFARARVQGRSGGRAGRLRDGRGETTATSSERLMAAASAPVRGGERRKEKKSKAKSNSARSGKAAKAAGPPTTSNDEKAQTRSAQPIELEGTAAGGGGRWVHVSN